MDSEITSPIKKIFKEYRKKNKFIFTLSGAALVIFLIIILLVSFGGKFGILFPKPFSRAANNTEAGTLKLNATFNSIGIELPFIGDDNGNATATVEFRKQGEPDTNWRKGLDLWRTTGAGDGLLANAGAVAGIVNEVAAQVPSPTPSGSKDCSKTSVGFTPLNDLGIGTYQGFQGGLYPNGSNQPPAAYLTQGLEYAGKIAPINGKIVLLTVGMSNTSQESINFQKKVTGDSSSVNPNVVVINGAQAGWDAEKIKKQTEIYFATITTRLTTAGLSADQVQAVWLKEAIAGESSAFPIDAQNLKTDLEFIVSELRTRYPNLQIIYLSSRIYGGYAQPDKVSPEPFAYQGGFAYKWLIEDRINGANTRPWFAWGPYIWADGLIPRSDGLIWTCDDLEGDGIHPATSGENKVGQKLLEFFKNDSTASKWFMADGAVVPSPTPTPSATGGPSPIPTVAPTSTPAPTSSPAPGVYSGAFYGSLLQLDQNTNYDIKITLSDPEGVAGNNIITGSIQTRVDNIPSVSTLVPTHFVKTSGDDVTGNGSLTKPWKTISKALSSALPGAVVQVGPGYYKAGGSRSTPLTLIAQNPAVDDSGEIINSGNHTVIEGAVLSSPTGSTDGPNPGVWQQIDLIGPGFGGAPPGAIYKVWKWTGGGSSSQLGYATSRASLPQRVVKWKPAGTDLQTPEGWAEKLYTNQSYNFGYYTSGTDIYLRLPNGLKPNDLYMTGGNGSGLSITGPNIRVSGLEIRQFGDGISINENASFAVLDHNLLSGSQNNILLSGNKSQLPSKYGSDHVIEKNRIMDSNHWTDTSMTEEIIPRGFIKGKITNADGTEYSNNRIGEGSETGGVWATGGAFRVVVRKNVIDGPFNGVGAFNSGFDRYAAYNWDINDNSFIHIEDDAFEPEGNTINWRMWNNKIERAFVVLSTGPIKYGPIYLFRNTAWKIGAINETGGGHTFFKFSGSGSPSGRVFVLHNTFWTDFGITVDGGAPNAGGSGGGEWFYLRNNIIRATRYAFDTPANFVKWDEDYNHITTSDTTRGLDYGPTKYTTKVEDYRTAYLANTSQVTHSNIGWNQVTGKGSFIDTILLNDNLVNAPGGNLALKPLSIFIDSGTPVPNVSDVCGVSFTGSAPDLGAKEGTSGVSCPAAGPTSTPTLRPSATPTLRPLETPTPSPTGPGGGPLVTPTPLPTSGQATPTPSIQPVACSISSASWSSPNNPVEEGIQVMLNVTTFGNCTGSQVSFRIKENDTGLGEFEADGLLDDNANIQPVNGIVSNNSASTTWIAEYVSDGILGVANPPEYHFNASITGEGTPTLRSADPLLVVNRLQPDSLSITQGPDTQVASSSATITWVTNQPSSSQVSYTLDEFREATPNVNTEEQNINTRVTNHQVTLINLQPCTKYFIKVISRDEILRSVNKESSFVTGECTGGSNIISEASDFIRSLFGGEISLLDANSKGLQISIPNLFAAVDSFFQIKRLEASSVIDELKLPSGYQAAGANIYHIDAYTDPSNELKNFNNDLTVTINYSSSDVVGIDESSLKIYRFNTLTNTWEALSSCRVNTLVKTVTCQTNQFSDVALFGKPSSEENRQNPILIVAVVGVVIALIFAHPIRKYHKKHRS